MIDRNASTYKISCKKEYFYIPDGFQKLDKNTEFLKYEDKKSEIVEYKDIVRPEKIIEHALNTPEGRIALAQRMMHPMNLPIPRKIGDFFDERKY